MRVEAMLPVEGMLQQPEKRNSQLDSRPNAVNTILILPHHSMVPPAWCPTTPKCIVALCLRVSFGLSLLFVGVAHYLTISAFRGMVSDDLGVISMLGALWAYILPALMIVGGALLIADKRRDIEAWATGVALGSIPAGMLLKSVIGGLSLADTMPAAINAFVWIITYLLVLRISCCGSGTCEKPAASGM